MMLVLIVLLTVAMVLDCAALIFLVLIQLPKKEAGAGLAFGGSATDALFGAGSGNVLTKITKYAAGIFFALAIILSALQSNFHSSSTNSFKSELQKSTGPNIPAPAPAPVQAPSTPTVPTTSNATPLLSSQTNIPAPSAEAPNSGTTSTNSGK